MDLDLPVRVFGALGHGEPATQGVLFFTEMADDVFHHDDGTINDEAEVDGSEAHQVPADLVTHHAGHGKKHGKRDDEGDDERGAEVSQQGKEHDDD
jgi:hypothetical protein